MRPRTSRGLCFGAVSMSVKDTLSYQTIRRKNKQQRRLKGAFDRADVAFEPVEVLAKALDILGG